MATDLSPLHANLDALPPLTRRAIESSAADGLVQIHTAGGVMSASLRTPDGRSVRIHSGRDPRAEADQFIESALGALPGGAPSVVIVIGPGLGYMLEAIERRATDTKIIAIEPFPAVARAMLERRDWREWIASKRLTLLLGPDYLGAGDAGRLLDERAATSASIVEHPVVKRSFPAETARARAAADHVVQGARANAEARRAFAGRYLLNTLANLPEIAAEGDVSSLRDLFSGMPAIVVAAGPSLDEQLPHIKALEDRALIIAVDTALRPLKNADVQPHLVVAVDPSEANALHLLGVEDTSGTWLVTEGSIDPRVYPEFAGRVFTFKVSEHQPWPWLKTQGIERGTLRAWGSVLTTAFDFACFAGADPIVFVGADLAYTGGLHYCRGTMNEPEVAADAGREARVEAFAALQRPMTKVTDIHGEAVVSTPQFVQFRDWLVARAVEARPRRILNATGAGILHGEAITQVDLGAMEFPAGARDETRARLAAAWSRSLDERVKSRQRLETTFVQRASDAVPMSAWIEFTGGTLSARDIEASIEATWRTPPGIITEPQPDTVFLIPGWTVTFRAEATGGPRPAVQWQMSTDGGIAWRDIDGDRTNEHERELELSDAGKQLRATFMNRYGSAITRPAVINYAPTGIVYDFDGDGRPDILWHNTVTGANAVWFMSGAVRVGIGVLARAGDPRWQPVAAGDFSGDGKPDLFWHNSLNGLTSIWDMDTVNGPKRYGPSEPEPDVAWTVAGTGDFNGDGRSEILWRHSRTGAISIWSLDGMRRIGVGDLKGDPDITWTIVATGDLNGDGRPDILWRHVVTGDNRVWFMDGTARSGEAWLDSEPDLAWTVVGVGDFNDDGKPDILWRHAVTGDTRVWFMDGIRRTGFRQLDAATECTWQICPDAKQQGPL